MRIFFREREGKPKADKPKQEMDLERLKRIVLAGFFIVSISAGSIFIMIIGGIYNPADPNQLLFASYKKKNLVITKLMVLLFPNFVSSKDEGQRTLLHLAVKDGEKDMVSFLLSKRADPNARDISMETPLLETHYQQDIEMMKILLQAGGRVNDAYSNNETLLHFAVRRNNIKEVRLLLANGANVNSRSADGETPICNLGAGNIEIVKELINNGADINARDNHGRYPIHHLSWTKGAKEEVAYLLSRGAKINCRNYEGETPLHFASRHNCDDHNMVALLLSEGADLNAKDKDGCTPLDRAENARYYSDGKLIDYLKSRGAKRGREIK